MRKLLVVTGYGGVDGDTMTDVSVHIIDEKKLEEWAKDGSVKDGETRIFEIGKELEVVLEKTLKIKENGKELVSCEYPY